MTAKRLLIVCPHFPPSNTADCHRVRMLLPFFEASGWAAEVLAVDADCVAAPQDPWLVEGLPVDVPVHRVSVLGLAWSRIPGLGTLDFRAYRALKRRGSELLGERRFDLVLFSTTVFAIHSLGLYFRNEFGVPFVMDYQDLWTTDFYWKSGIRPPGGWIKYSVSQAIGNWQQRKVLKGCSGLIAVNQEYFSILAQEHPIVAHLPKLALPFPGCTRDADRVQSETTKQTIFPVEDRFVNWVYVGVCGPLMERALTGLFGALAVIRKRTPEVESRLRLNFIGTSYAPSGEGVLSVKPIAERFGLADIVYEKTDRIPFSTALKCLADAHVLVVPGTNDPSYTASKVYQYLLTQKPLVAIFRRESTVCNVLRNVGGGHCVTFAEDDSERMITDAVLRVLQDVEPFITPNVPLDTSRFEPFTDSASAKTLSSFLSRVAKASK